MRLKYQVFFALLVSSAVLIALMYAISSWTFSRGFLSYVNQAAVERVLIPAAERLVTKYEKEGGWEWVEDHPQFAREFTVSSGADTQSDRRLTARKRNGGDKRPPRARGRKGDFPRLVLTDANKNILAGRIPPNANMQWEPLTSDAQLVGYVGLPKLKRVDRQFDQAFESQQKKSLGLAALAMALISGLLSILLASRLVAPLLKVSKSVKALSDGDYQQTLTLNRRDEIGDLASDINSLSNTLEQNRTARQRWIAEISHELRTPLAVLRGEVEALQDGVREPDAKSIGSLHTEVMNLGRLVDDLHTLSLSDLGALDYRFEPVELPLIVRRVIDAHGAQIADASLAVTITNELPNSRIQADVQRIEQLLSNLLQNTIRYTDAPGVLNIRLAANHRSGKTQAVITWQDSSPGVADLDIAKLFDPLFRVEASRNRLHGGAGLGLSIAKNIVEAHGGTIDAATSELGGLALTIQLPIIKDV